MSERIVKGAKAPKFQVVTSVPLREGAAAPKVTVPPETAIPTSAKPISAVPEAPKK